MKSGIILLGCALSVVGLFFFQVTNLNSFASTYDQVDFALALERYDLLAMQPHFPGYPYFILGGTLLHQWVSNKAASLTLFNILLYTSALIPIYKISRVHLSRSISVLVTTLTYSSGYVVVMVNQPMSEGAAIAVLWWYIWSIYTAFNKQGFWRRVFPLFLLSILLGIRLSYIPFSVGVVFLFYRQWKDQQLTLKEIINFAFLAVFFQLLWIGGVALTEGGFVGFMNLALAFTSGHFNDWGGTATSVDSSFFSRLYQLIIQNIIWTGIGVRSFILLSIFLVLFFCLLRVFHRKEMSSNVLLQLIFLLFLTYFVWALFAQNVEKPRHTLPLVTLGVFIMYSLLFSKGKTGFITVCTLILLSVQTYETGHLLKEQAKELPATYQLATYLENQTRPFVIYAWEESRVFTYLEASFGHKEINTYSTFLHDQSYYKDKEILLTNSVVEGFLSQGVDLTGKVEMVEEFSSNSLFDPVYHHIVLYKWLGNN